MANEKLLKATEYVNAGLSVIPVNKEKRPTLDEWTPFKNRIARESEIKEWFKPGNKNVAVIGGKVSGNLEFLDFDYLNVTREFFEQWAQMVEEMQPGLLDKPVIERSPHGVHFCYRCPEVTIPGNTDLAKKAIEVAGPGYHLYGHKPHKATKQGDKWFIVVTHIETRGEGGYCVIDPSDGYKLTQGSYTDLPVITKEERDILIESARACNAWIPEIHKGYQERQSRPGEKLPGQDFDERGDIRGVLEKHGWAFQGNGNDGRERWLRPGKIKGTSATLTDGKIFYPFSSNSHPFESGRPYGPFAVYTLLEHNGDFSQAAKALTKQGYGEQSKNKKRSSKGVSLSNMKNMFSEKTEFLWRNHIPKGMASKIDGREGDGKTNNGLCIAREILEKNPKGIVLWVATEGAVQDTFTKAIAQGLPNDRFLIVRKSDETFKYDFLRQADINEFQEYLDNLNEPILAVFIDSIRGMSSLEDNDPKNGHLMHKLNAIVCDKHRAAIVYIDHHGKGQKSNLRDKSVGTTAKNAAVRVVLAVTPKGRSKYVRRVQIAKSNLGDIGGELESIEIDGRITIRKPETETEESTIGRAEQFLIDLFKEQTKYPATEIYGKGAEVDLPASTLRKAKGW